MPLGAAKESYPSALAAQRAYKGRTPAITYSPDWQRINALPVRWVDKAAGLRLARELTPDLVNKRVAGHEALMLKWQQGLALWEIFHCRGAFLGMPVGAGKTLVSWLAAIVLGCKRFALVVAEALHEKTLREFKRFRDQGWACPPPIELVGLSQLRQRDNLRFLDERGFDGVFIDECDLMRNFETSAPMRCERFKVGSIPMREEDGEWWVDVDVSAYSNPELPNLAEVGALQTWARCRGVPFICATGTTMRWSILDCAHLLNWACEHGSPFPHDEAELKRWALALDDRGVSPHARRRMRPGALCDLIEVPAEYHQGTELELARANVQHRIRATPGVLIITEYDCDQPLTINLIQAPDDPVIESDFGIADINPDDPRGLLTCWRMPDGAEVIDSLTFWRGQRELGCGFHGYWDPAPRQEWRDARRAYFKLVEAVIKATAWSLDPKDTAGAVADAFPDDPVVKAWRDIKDCPYEDGVKAKLQTKIAWRSSSVVNWGAQWLREHPGCQLWVESIPFGAAVAAAAGVPFYGAEGETETGANIEYCPMRETNVISIGANTRGRNLHEKGYYHGGVIGMPQSAEKIEQLLGRYHRDGQKNGVVFDVLLTSGGTRYALDVAIREAENVLSMMNQKQKLLRARINYCELPKDDFRWQRKEA